MAATPSKPSSPSQQQVTESEPPVPSSKDETQVQAPEQQEQQVELQLQSEEQQQGELQQQAEQTQIPTYEQVEQSEDFQLAKSLLQQGEFEQALNVIEQAIINIKQLFPEEDEDDLMHESLAPLHYLYGTTLLYSIEESSTDAMTTTVADTAAAAAATADPDAPPTDAEDHDATAAEVAADDMEIAWENLEAARAIVETMLRTRSNASESHDSKLHLDLAQIYLREGDLQRMNGRYQAAVDDYTACLQHRTQCLGKYDRKIADVHYNLALSHQLLVAELANATEEPQRSEQSNTAEVVSRQAKSRFASFHHYLECCKTLCGQIAIMCGQEAEQVLQDAEKQMPQFKSTGEEDEGNMREHLSPQLCSIKLSAYRTAVAQLQPPDILQNEYDDLNELLVEIQETVDEAENSEKGVKQVTDMKAQISAAIAQAAAAEEAEANVGGDDNVATAPATSTTSMGFGSAAAMATTATAQPIMAVRKKKKRDEDVKPPPNDDSAKRPRTAE